MFLLTLYKIANKLDKLGYYEIANNIDNIIKNFASGDWTLDISNKVKKGLEALPSHVRSRADNFLSSLKSGPNVGGNWHNYSKLPQIGVMHYHAHIKDGHPTYVACWEVIDIPNKIIKIRYIGTREKAPY